jgi:hypothetical protein
VCNLVLMSYAENPEKWHQLNALYANKSDDELLELQTVYADLTEDAQSILRAELDHRKLSADSRPLPDLQNEPAPQPVDPPSEIDIDTYSEYELLQMGGDAQLLIDSLKNDVGEIKKAERLGVSLLINGESFYAEIIGPRRSIHSVPLDAALRSANLLTDDQSRKS